MAKICLTVNDASASARVDGVLTAGAVGIPVEVSITGERWDGLAPRLYARNGSTDMEMVIGGDGLSAVPWECMIAGGILKCGVDGVAPDASVRIPTVWASCGIVLASAADANPGEHIDPTPDIVDQILAQSYRAEVKAQSVVDRADAGEFKGDPGKKGDKGDPGEIDPESIGNAVADYLQKHPMDVPVKSVNGQTGDVLISVPTKTSDLRNDSGFLTQHQDIGGKQDKIDDLDAIRAGASKGETALQSFTETDPTVPSWAKQPNKPSYSYNELTDKPTIPAAYDDADIRKDIAKNKEDLSLLDDRTSTLETAIVGVDDAISRLEAAV